MPEAKPSSPLHSSFMACTLSIQMPMLFWLRLHQTGIKPFQDGNLEPLLLQPKGMRRDKSEAVLPLLRTLASYPTWESFISLDGSGLAIGLPLFSPFRGVSLSLPGKKGRNHPFFSERGRNFSRPIGFYLKLSKINIFDSMGCESAQWWQHRFAFVSMHTCGLQWGL